MSFKDKMAYSTDFGFEEIPTYAFAAVGSLIVLSLIAYFAHKVYSRSLEVGGDNGYIRYDSVADEPGEQIDSEVGDKVRRTNSNSLRY